MSSPVEILPITEFPNKNKYRGYLMKLSREVIKKGSDKEILAFIDKMLPIIESTEFYEIIGNISLFLGVYSKFNVARSFISKLPERFSTENHIATDRF